MPLPSRQALERDPDLSTLVTALGTAGWLEMLDNPALTYTVFAPTSEPLHMHAACLKPWKPTVRCPHSPCK